MDISSVYTNIHLYEISKLGSVGCRVLKRRGENILSLTAIFRMGEEGSKIPSRSTFCFPLNRSFSEGRRDDLFKKFIALSKLSLD